MSFKDKVIEIVKSIPEGKVLSYGDVAALADVPRGGRQVGWILAGLGIAHSPDAPQIPWWRVVNRHGYISIKGHDIEIKNIQASLLRAEGIEVSADFQLDMDTYRWSP